MVNIFTPVEAFDDLGYIINQSPFTDVPFGNYPSSNNGCGWIVLYNLLHHLNIQTNPTNAIKLLEPYLKFGGFFGVSNKSLQKAMKNFVDFECAYTKNSGMKLFKEYDVIIIEYLASVFVHYVFAYKINDTEFRFLNINSDGIHTPEEFYRKFNKFPIVLTIGIEAAK